MVLRLCTGEFIYEPGRISRENPRHALPQVAALARTTCGPRLYTTQGSLITEVLPCGGLSGLGGLGGLWCWFLYGAREVSPDDR